jgi:hypothetical protein
VGPQKSYGKGTKKIKANHPVKALLKKLFGGSVKPEPEYQGYRNDALMEALAFFLGEASVDEFHYNMLKRYRESGDPAYRKDKG